MTITASFNLQSLNHGELKALFALLIKLLTMHLDNSEIRALIMAMLRRLEREIHSRLNASFTPHMKS